ncbi:hypothetical protein ACRYJU_04585 [Alloalcanivorax xenomutans]|uniref:Uncharacterized protein n=1 Tax=Alcanivorax xiamenensis TaxID=1177156 RepID=A0ABQ6Y5H2_9GAMM|nr:hypothetical protein [Alcanivorax xiamenensis]KAF0804397.1 hypothetical protein A6D6_03134 [Alcanivorax xiamenensis]
MIEYFAPGQHPRGFVGFQVTGCIDGHTRKATFSTRTASSQNKSNLWVRYQWLSAVGVDLDWKIEQRERAYQRFVTTDDPKTPAGRGLGVHGLTAVFYVSGDDWVPAFSVARHPDVLGHPQADRRFTFAHAPYSDVWRDAVLFWAEEHAIEDSDRARLLAHPPEPTLFSALRRRMNEEGHDIFTEALSPVFREQRTALAAARASTSAPAHERTRDLEAALLDDLSDWYRRQKKEQATRRNAASTVN